MIPNQTPLIFFRRVKFFLKLGEVISSHALLLISKLSDGIPASARSRAILQVPLQPSMKT